MLGTLEEDNQQGVKTLRDYQRVSHRLNGIVRTTTITK
jgi:hypothetical protein